MGSKTKPTRRKTTKTFSEKARKTAEKIIEKIGDFEQQGDKLAHYLSAGDSWGPSVADMRDGEELVLNKVAKLIERYMK
jgi:hypothetical protein